MMNNDWDLFAFSFARFNWLYTQRRVYHHKFAVKGDSINWIGKAENLENTLQISSDAAAKEGCLAELYQKYPGLKDANAVDAKVENQSCVQMNISPKRVMLFII